MLVKKQTIKLKEGDIRETSVKSLKRLAWESKRTGRSLSEQVHQHPRHRKPKYKESLGKEIF